mmetsp:Transcript_51304/g.103084  ORF Transcript_51304/g.103084 Transcript_51304/m.103084 type:complete len:90 (+) Transcript_51304:113-382(+)
MLGVALELGKEEKLEQAMAKVLESTWALVSGLELAQVSAQMSVLQLVSMMVLASGPMLAEESAHSLGWGLGADVAVLMVEASAQNLAMK